MQNHENEEAQLAVESLLAGLNRDQMQSLLQKLVEQESSFITTIEKHVALLRTSSPATTTSPTTPAKPPVAVG